MKTAISVPDDIFKQAEKLVKKSKTSRSELYSRALAEYVARHAGEHVTEEYDRVVRAVGNETDVFSTSAAARTLRKTEW